MPKNSNVESKQQTDLCGYLASQLVTVVPWYRIEVEVELEINYHSLLRECKHFETRVNSMSGYI